MVVVEQPPCLALGASHRGDLPGSGLDLRAHEALKKREGLLLGAWRLSDKILFPVGDLCESLVINDYSCVPSGPLSYRFGGSEAYTCLQRAGVGFEEEKVLGSSQKDNFCVELFRAARGGISLSAYATLFGGAPAALSLLERIGSGGASLLVEEPSAFSSCSAAMLSGSWASFSLPCRYTCRLAVWSLFFGAGLSEKVEGMVLPSILSSTDELVEL